MASVTKTVVRAMERTAPLRLAEQWDNVNTSSSNRHPFLGLTTYVFIGGAVARVPIPTQKCQKDIAYH